MINMTWVMKTCFIRKTGLSGPENRIDGNMVTVLEILRGFCRWASRLIVQILVFVLFFFWGKNNSKWVKVKRKPSCLLYKKIHFYQENRSQWEGRCDELTHTGNVKPSVKHQVAVVISSDLWVLLSFLINDSFHLGQFTLGKQLELWFKWQAPLSNY